MAEKNPRRNETIDALFDAILSLGNAGRMLRFLRGSVYRQGDLGHGAASGGSKAAAGRQHLRADRKTVEISTATISRINRCIQYGTGGYRQTIEKVREKQQ